MGVQGVIHLITWKFAGRSQTAGFGWRRLCHWQPERGPWARRQVFAPYTRAEFSSAVELVFRTALASLACTAGGACGIRPDDIAIAASDAPPATRRRLLAGLLVDVAIGGLESAAAAASVAGGATESQLNVALAARGIRAVAVTRAARAEAAKPLAHADSATASSVAVATTPAPAVVTVGGGAIASGASGCRAMGHLGSVTLVFWAALLLAAAADLTAPP